MNAPHTSIQAEIDPVSLNDPGHVFLRRYWESKRGGRAMPARKDMVPADLKRYLDGIVMIDVLPGTEEFRYRLIGTAVTQYFLVDPTGKTIAEAWAPAGHELSERIRSNLRAVVRACRPLHVWGAVNWTGSREEIFDVLFLPLSDDGENVNMIVNLFTFDRAQVLTDRRIARSKGRRRLLS